MAVATGHRVTLGFADEITYGTPVAAVKWSEFVRENLHLMREPVVKESLRRVSESNTFQPGKRVEGDIEMECMYDGQLRFWKHLFGAVVDSGAGPDFTHTFTLADLLPIGQTIEVGRDLQGFRYHGMKINEATIACDATDGPEALLRSTFAMAGEDEEKFTVGAATFPTERLIEFHTAAHTIAGASEDIDSFEVTINNGLKADRWKQGSALVKEPVRDARRVISGSITKDFETGDIADFYDKFTGHTDVALKFRFVGAVLGGSNYSWTLDLFRVKFMEVPIPTDGPPIVKLTIPFHALYDEAGAQDAARLVVVNSESAT